MRRKDIDPASCWKKCLLTFPVFDFDVYIVEGKDFPLMDKKQVQKMES